MDPERPLQVLTPGGKLSIPAQWRGFWLISDLSSDSGLNFSVTVTSQIQMLFFLILYLFRLKFLTSLNLLIEYSMNNIQMCFSTVMHFSPAAFHVLHFSYIVYVVLP